MIEILELYRDNEVADPEQPVYIDVPSDDGFMEEEFLVSGITIYNDGTLHLKGWYKDEEDEKE